MKLQYLGTAAAEAVPSPFCSCRVCENARKVMGKEVRTRSQAVIDNKLVLDYPPDTYYHMIRFGLDMRKADHVFLTHSHQDHFYPEDIILRRPDVASPLAGKLYIHGNERCRELYDRRVTMEHRPEESFTNYQDYGTATPFQTIETGEYRVTPLKANHDKREECLIYHIEDSKGKSLLYGNDSGLFPEETWEYFQSAHFDLVSLDCTMQKLPGAFNHMSIADNAEVKQRLLAMGAADEKTKFVMTHFSHNGGCTHEEIEEIGKRLGFLIAWDGMTVEA